MIVDSIMRRAVVTLDAGRSVREAAVKMAAHAVGSVVVTRAGRVVGIVTERDLVARVLARGDDADRTPLERVMSAPVASVAPDASVEDAASAMKRAGIKRLVVLRDGALVGIVSVTDVAYAEPQLQKAMLDAWVRQRWEG